MPIALAFTAPLLNSDRKLANFFMRPAVRAALASYILMVSVVYHVLIVPYWNPQGVTWLTATGLNIVMPILYIVDWLLTNVYPSTFLNVAELGIGNVLLNMFGLVAVFAVVGPIFITAAHLISDRTES